jgi:hypothetical protein
MEGNPTKSLEVNAFIKMVKKRGKKTRCSFNGKKGFDQKRIQNVASSFQDPESSIKHLELTWKFGMPAFLNYQFHLLASIDNTTQVTIDNICVHNEFSNCLKTKLKW